METKGRGALAATSMVSVAVPATLLLLSKAVYWTVSVPEKPAAET